ncbi:MAG: APC family permease [Candidatus Micrarchaeia archaeon]
MGETAPELAKGSIGLLGLTIISMAGILAIIGPMEVAPFISSAGPAAIWPVIVGFILFLIVSLPILEYTKLTPFAGGYYGLAELGFGRAMGKYTATTNYVFYLLWQMTNAFAMPAILMNALYLLYGIMLPIWAWLLISALTLGITNGISSLHVKNLSKVLVIITIITTVIVAAFTIYVIARSPFNSFYFLNPLNSYSGFTGIATGTAIYGFFLYVGYGSTLFYSEEAKHGRRDVWRAVYLSLGISTVVIALAAYSELVSVPMSQFSTITSSTLPMMVTWIHYIPASFLLGLTILVVLISMVSFGAGGGSQSRLMWSMARDKFIDVAWLRKLNKSKVPVNAIIFQLLVSFIMVLIVAFSMVKIYGYSISTVTTAWFLGGAAGTIVWYFHHFIPEFGLFPYLRKHKEIKYSIGRRWIIGLIIPIAGTALFIYTFYVGIISDLVEPYFAFLIADVIVLVMLAFFVYYKAKKKALGDSVVSYMAAEAEKIPLSNEKEQ